jgi:hypothetical protein
MVRVGLGSGSRAAARTIAAVSCHPSWRAANSNKLWSCHLECCAHTDYAGQRIDRQELHVILHVTDDLSGILVPTNATQCYARVQKRYNDEMPL